MPASLKRKAEKAELTPNQKINKLFDGLFGTTEGGQCRSHTDPQGRELYGWVRVRPDTIKVLEEWNNAQGGDHNDFGVSELVEEAVTRHCALLVRREDRKEKKAAELAELQEVAEIDRTVKALLADIGEEGRGDELSR